MKAMVLNHLRSRKKLNHGDTIINEFTLDNFSRRADLSIINNNRLFGFEIKSKNDNLSRLEGQVEKYLQHFDKVIIFSDKKHVSKIEEIVPENVEIWELNKERILLRRRGQIQEIKDKESLIKMMKVNELYQLASRMSLKNGSKTRAVLESDLKTLPEKVIRDAAINSLKLRFRITTSLFWQQISDEVKPHDLKALSPYSSQSDTRRESAPNNFKSILDLAIEGNIF